MILRQSTENEVHIPKTQDNCERNMKVFVNVIEISTLEQVDGFLRDFTTNPTNTGKSCLYHMILSYDITLSRVFLIGLTHIDLVSI